MSDADRTNEIPPAPPTSRSLVDERRATAQMSRPPIPNAIAATGTLMGTPPPPPRPTPSKPPVPKAAASVEELESAELEDDIDFPAIDKTAPFHRDEILAVAKTLSPTPAAGRPFEETIEQDRGTQPTLEALTDDEEGPGDTVILPRGPQYSEAHASIAPISIDAPRSADATLRLPAQRGSLASVPDTSLPQTPMSNMGLIWAIAGGIAACAAIAITAAVALTGDEEPKASTTTTTAASAPAAPRTADHGVRSAVIETPESAATKNPAAPGEPVTTTTTSALASAPAAPPPVEASEPPPVKAAKEPRVAKEPKEAAPPKESKTKTAKAAPPPPTTTTTQTPAPPPPPVAAAPPPPPKPVATTGTVIVPDSMMTITVDGEYRRVNGGRVVVQCGPHRITAGIKGTQQVNVPCGGSVSL